MKAYVINLPSATDRREALEGAFSDLRLRPIFVEAIDGKKLVLPDPRYNEAAYRRAHGKQTNLGELGCYLSHIKALKTFLESSDEHALVLEDDIKMAEGFDEIIEEVLEYQIRFDLLRLSGLHKGTPVKIAKLRCGYNLCCSYSRQTGSGAYLVNRRAASIMVEALLPMWLPYDHAFDREWRWGVKSMCLNPMAVRQNVGFISAIKASKSYKLPPIKRYSTVFPYRAYNETSRVLARSLAILKNKTQNLIQSTDLS